MPCHLMLISLALPELDVEYLFDERLRGGWIISILERMSLTLILTMRKRPKLLELCDKSVWE